MTENKFAHVLEDAKKFYAEFPSYVAFNERYFGLGSKFMPRDRAGRAEYVSSPEYKEIQKMAFKLEERQTGGEEREGRDMKPFVFRIPFSIYQGLKAEAAKEKTSINQLLLAKACIPLRLYRALLANAPDLLYDEDHGASER